MTETFDFVAPLMMQDRGMRMYYVPLPIDIGDAFTEAKVRRIVGTVNGAPIRRALHGRRDAERTIMLSKAFVRQQKLALGDMVPITLSADPDPDFVDVPEEFEAALQHDPEAAERFASFTPGKKRSLVTYIHTAKRTETRMKRALEMAYKLRTYTLNGDRPDDA
ncbi:MAG: hypothetical protein RhofKO_25400 [Rhodothermales bacterium]